MLEEWMIWAQLVKDNPVELLQKMIYLSILAPTPVKEKHFSKFKLNSTHFACFLLKFPIDYNFGSVHREGVSERDK